MKVFKIQGRTIIKMDAEPINFKHPILSNDNKEIMKTPIEALIQDFTTMRENILKGYQNQETSVILTTLNLCITKAQDKKAEEKEVVINSYAAGISKNSFFGPQKGHVKQAEKYFKNKFES